MIWIRLGSILLFLGVGLGAFAAHGLKGKLSTEAMEIYHTAVLYHFIHGLGLLTVGWLATLKPNDKCVRVAGWTFLTGIILFSGSLYLLAITGETKLGIITPFGGLAFLTGWDCLALAARPR